MPGGRFGGIYQECREIRLVVAILVLQFVYGYVALNHAYSHAVRLFSAVTITFTKAQSLDEDGLCASSRLISLKFMRHNLLSAGWWKTTSSTICDSL